MPQILIVEDSPSLADACELWLAPLGAGMVRAATLAEARVAIAGQGFDVVLLDLRLPDGDGLALLADIGGGNERPRVIVMTAHAAVSVAVEAMQAGAADFLVKPFDRQRLLTTVANAIETRRLARLVRGYRQGSRLEHEGNLVGSSPAMARLHRMIESAAPSRASVFLFGESGTGKELCALALHRLSPRRDRPFVPLNCAALPRELIESEIFGHREGAFTGATRDREGAALRAHGGTLFLDEICEMDLSLQGKLLRFLQSGMVHAVGSDTARPVDVRIVCATNRDPRGEVEAGRFREDLFYRLYVVPIGLPPLRERGDDAAEIAEIFVRQLAAEEGKAFRRLSPQARERILAWSWPGNVRELRNIIQTAVVLHDGEVLEATMLPAHIGGAAAGEAAVARQAPCSPETILPLGEVERRAIRRAIALCDGNVVQASVRLEVAPSTLYRKLQAWGEKT